MLRLSKFLKQRKREVAPQYRLVSYCLVGVSGGTNKQYQYQLQDKRGLLATRINMASASSAVFPPFCVDGIGMKGYEKEYKRSIENGDEFWREKAMQFLTWDKTFDCVLQGDMKDGSVAWFPGGKLNACYNAVDRHARSKGDQVALIYEADKRGEGCTITYSELLQRICKVANAMKHSGVQRGDIVSVIFSTLVHWFFHI